MKTVIYFVILVLTLSMVNPAQARHKPKPPPCPQGPIVILLHGGGWQSGHPQGMMPHVYDFHRHGIRAKSIGYPFGSVIGAINRVRLEIAKERCGPVITYGVSAGGTIAAYLAAEGSVAGAINVGGPFDFTRWVGPVAMEMMPKVGLNSYSAKREASPYWRLSKTSPQLLQCGVADFLVTYDQCLRYHRAARRSQGDITIHTIAGHGQHFKSEVNAAREWIAKRWPTIHTRGAR